eukprot:gnl/MRDRNA2_/MRDRNA2_36128_c0_seq1.p1 gnl/MRDRNA2_/MRDRNA2_36128_c0~~gnl/MRDRNA2_/MRDRNA2_36128_c0_seq1.p1  ORF type:complete len:845 (-),score=130.12 gnl/MRDRNA2_/MRDRNA2_36128_c0_seq1:115-2649(-)
MAQWGAIDRNPARQVACNQVGWGPSCFDPSLGAAAPWPRAAYRSPHELWCSLLDRVSEEYPLMIDPPGGGPDSHSSKPPELGDEIVGQACSMLAQGGEFFRSFLQFLTQSDPTSRQQDDSIALRRSCAAMRLACRVLCSDMQGTPWSSELCTDFVVHELLGGLQPQSRGHGIHICAVLRCVLCTGGPAGCHSFLQYGGPYILLRGLDRPGCAELLLWLLVGTEVPSLGLGGPGVRMVQMVLAYIQATSWNGTLAKLLDAVSTQPASKSNAENSIRPLEESPARASPYLGRHPSIEDSPYAIMEGRSRCDSDGNVPSQSPLVSLDPVPSSPSPTTFPPEDAELPDLPPYPHEGGALLDATSFLAQPVGPILQENSSADQERKLVRKPESISPNKSPCPFGKENKLPPAAPTTPGRKRWTVDTPPQTPPTGAPCQSPPNGTPSFSSTPGRGILTPGPDVGKAAGPPGGGISLLLEFLQRVLENCTRLDSQPGGGGPLGETRRHLLKLIFVDNNLVARLFRVLRQGTARWDTVSLLSDILQQALVLPHGCIEASESVFEQCIPHLEALGTLLLRSVPKAGRKNRRPREIRLNAYTVNEPLGTLRTSAVHILAAVCDRGPEKALPLLRPSLWSLLLQWFFIYRCNHIFQAACSRLLSTAVRKGDVKLQRLILVKYSLLHELSDAVLAEAGSSDPWHELRPRRESKSTPSASSTPGCARRVDKVRVAIRRPKHPGGLGGMVPVLLAIRDVAKKTDSEGSFVAQLVSSTPNWPQVLQAISTLRPTECSIAKPIDAQLPSVPVRPEGGSRRPRSSAVNHAEEQLGPGSRMRIADDSLPEFFAAAEVCPLGD